VKVRRYVLTYFLTSSSLDKLKSLRILEALLGPLILGFSTSVKPGKSLSPFFTITKFRTERSGLTMQPRTDFLLRSPLRLPYPRKQGVPAQTNIKSLTRVCEENPLPCSKTTNTIQLQKKKIHCCKKNNSSSYKNKRNTHSANHKSTIHTI
jgi:hypothetical protein